MNKFVIIKLYAGIFDGVKGRDTFDEAVKAGVQMAISDRKEQEHTDLAEIEEELRRDGDWLAKDADIFVCIAEPDRS